jgi:hypothetical protein
MASPHQHVIRAVRYSVSTCDADNLLFRHMWVTSDSRGSRWKKSCAVIPMPCSARALGDLKQGCERVEILTPEFRCEYVVGKVIM